eukprot:CAMPEP_0196657722 /NCGR_PEP_ID=MMETSP1086-20130531/25168_1 /TAXON_ID=77921 /ORGANISM="Cyanoptyche  gloeocystis , Strain SAG4.97" /LENGTH=70 /DNA_ID=CAMNT_0041990965 /DNA_START=238 /DNA_END=450 /DNA_ORIENTATION=+
MKTFKGHKTDYGEARTLQLVEETVEGRDALGEALAFAGGEDDIVCLVAGLQGVAVHDLPVVEHTLREGLS